ncbi:hypothetical protein [Cellulomonas carbonis]|uniref:ATP synthase protein I n=1 Tax=Cellulomonas carbonis T26 TaxID=947969 RepID=A0A0A0BUF7_9CELL|nr:hypothetical protein [Cellulomonas carbonis]KGM10739.1 hypothetical protein N868_13870 [Cellulomonas carbonis T26]GGC12005.1 hypothetical protein GCM10010972_26640 [Cellulomonas carbonis]
MTTPDPVPDRPVPDQPALAGEARPSGGAVHAVFRRALRDMLVLVAAVAVLGVGIGYALEGVPGVWGALIGAGVALVFSGTTVLSMLRTADASATTTGAVILGAWLVKMLLLVVLFAVLDDLTFYDREVLVVVVLAGVLGSVYLDYRAVRTGRVPYVEPAAGHGS